MVTFELRRRVPGVSSAIALWFFLASATIASAQCGYDVCVDVDDYVARVDGNDIQGVVSASLSGPYQYYFGTCVYGWLYQDATQLAVSGVYPCSATYGGPTSYTFPATALPATGSGPWTYGVWGYHFAWCPAAYCGVEVDYPTYTDGWDGYAWGDLEIQRPTISGFCCGTGGDYSFWNLGPGSADPQPTMGGSYVQSQSLTFNSNCVPSGACTATPMWHLTTSNNQTQLSGTSGSTTTIMKGTSQGNCAYDSTLTADTGGFLSASYAVAVDSPGTAVHTGYGGVPAEQTEAWNDGYTTNWSFGILDVCGVNALLAIPVNEVFPSGFSNENGGSNYVQPPGASNPFWDYTDWENSYVFVDQIGQCCGAQNPAVTFTSAGPPYTYNTVYLDGAHALYGGSTTIGDGWQIYFSGTIQYYRDHGDNTP